MTDCLAATPHLMVLEPILGAAIAANFAYLNIKKFEYIRQVRKIIKLKIDKLDPNVKDSVQSTKWFKQLESLSNLDADEDLPLPRDKFWLQAPRIWGVLYNLFFYWPLGRLFSIISTIYCLLILLLGVGHEAKAFTFLSCDLSGAAISNTYIWVTISLLWPLAMVSIGAFIGSRANRFVNYQTDQLKNEATTDAKNALKEAELALNKTRV